MDPQNITKTSNILPEKPKVKIGVSFNGRQTPGGESVIQGLLAYTKSVGGTLIGFIGGTKGIFDNNAIEINDDNIDFYRN